MGSLTLLLLLFFRGYNKPNKQTNKQRKKYRQNTTCSFDYLEYKDRRALHKVVICRVVNFLFTFSLSLSLTFLLLLLFFRGYNKPNKQTNEQTKKKKSSKHNLQLGIMRRNVKKRSIVFFLSF